MFHVNQRQHLMNKNVRHRSWQRRAASSRSCRTGACGKRRPSCRCGNLSVCLRRFKFTAESTVCSPGLLHAHAHPFAAAAVWPPSLHWEAGGIIAHFIYPCFPARLARVFGTARLQDAVGFQPSAAAASAVAAAAAARAAAQQAWRAERRSVLSALSALQCSNAAPLYGRDAVRALTIEQTVQQVNKDGSIEMSTIERGSASAVGAAVLGRRVAAGAGHCESAY